MMMFFGITNQNNGMQWKAVEIDISLLQMLHLHLLFCNLLYFLCFKDTFTFITKTYSNLTFPRYNMSNKINISFDHNCNTSNTYGRFIQYPILYRAYVFFGSRTNAGVSNVGVEKSRIIT